jgi:hypothetical protein
MSLRFKDARASDEKELAAAHGNVADVEWVVHRFI